MPVRYVFVFDGGSLVVLRMLEPWRTPSWVLRPRYWCQEWRWFNSQNGNSYLLRCGIAALSSFIYRQFLLRLRSSLASWPTLHSSATNWLIGGCACLWRETRQSYTQLPTRYLRSRRHGRPNSWIILFPLTLDKNNIIYITIYVSKQITNLSQNKKQNLKDYANDIVKMKVWKTENESKMKL